MSELMNHRTFVAHGFTPSQVDLVIGRGPPQIGPTATSVVDAHQDVRIPLKNVEKRIGKSFGLLSGFWILLDAGRYFRLVGFFSRLFAIEKLAASIRQ